jgi:hypothetical protein
MKADLYVSPKGDDANPGTRAKPLRSISRAAEIIKAGGTCLVRGGRYRETVRLTKSGTKAKPMRFLAAPGETVILDGTEPVAGEWQKHKGKIYKTTVKRDFAQLFADGKMMLEARWPNIGFGEILSRKGWAPTGKGSRYGKIVDPKLAKTGVNWSGALATLNVAHQFFTWSRRVASHRKGSRTLHYPKNLPVITHYAKKTRPWEDNRYYLSGKLEALDRPGEWFLDPESKTLYLWTLDGDDPAKHEVAFKTRDYGIDGEGIKHVRIEGFEFFGCTLRLTKSAHCTVEGCHLLFPTYTRDLTELAAKRRPTVSTLVSGEHNVVKGCSLAFSPTGGITVLGSHNLVEDCLVHGVCWNGSLQYVGIKLGPRPGMGASPGKPAREEGESVVRRCTVFNCGNTCVHAAGMPRMRVEYCHIYDGGLACKDVSLLYTQLPMIAGTVFAHNWVHGCHAPHIALGIRGDDQTRGLVAHHNVVWDCGWVGIVIKGDRNKVHNNTVLGSGRCDILLRSRPEPKKPWRRQWPLLKRQHANSEASNNCARKIGAGQWGPPPPLSCKGGNNYSGRTPMLVDPEKLDFRPRKGSPLIDAGRKIPGFTDGFKGEAPDIGAYEFGGEKWVPGVTWPTEAVRRRLYRELQW